MRRFAWMIVLAAVGCTDGADLRNSLSGREPDPLGGGPDARQDARILDAATPDLGRLDQMVVDANPPRLDQDLPVDMHTPDRTAPPADAAPITPDAQLVDTALADARPNDAQPPDAQMECVPEAEICDGIDNNCNGQIDEGFDQPEVCNAQDDDCDGRIDENINAMEICNGEDDDCDGYTDEGMRNACDGCGPAPEERCNGLDEDCDGRTDEGVCRDAMAYVLAADGNAWEAPEELNAPDFVRAGDVDAAFATQGDNPAIWAIVRGDAYRFDLRRGLWDAAPARRLFSDFAPVDGAFTVVIDPARPEQPKLTTVRDDRYTDFIFDSVRRVAMPTGGGIFSELFADEPSRPAAPYEAMVLQTGRAPDFWQREVPGCDVRANTRMLGVLARDVVFEAPVGCNRYSHQQAAAFWPAFRLEGTPDPRRIGAWAFVPDPAQHVVFLKPGRGGRGR